MAVASVSCLGHTKAWFVAFGMTLTPSTVAPIRLKAIQMPQFWLVSSSAFRCSFVARQIAVKVQKGLCLTKIEEEAVSRMQARCPDGHCLRGPSYTGDDGPDRVVDPVQILIRHHTDFKRNTLPGLITASY